VTGERRLDDAPDVRFGGVKLRFVPAGMNPDELAANAARAAAAAERKRAAPLPSPITAPADLEAGPSKTLWILLALVVVAAVLFVLRGRA
jgi:hypothetical protein